jgi:hypothetical protein
MYCLGWTVDSSCVYIRLLHYYTNWLFQEGSRELEAELEAQLEQAEIKNKVPYQTVFPTRENLPLIWIRI